MSLTEKVLRGMSWTLASRVSTQAFQLLFGIALARLLTPAEFGVMGMLLVFTGFAQILSDCGFSSALIYKQNTTELQRSTAFWLQLMMGAAISACFYGGAAAISSFYGVPVLKPLSRLISVIFLLQALGQVHSALLAKEFRFKRLAFINVTSVMFSGLCAIGLAWRDYGIWALAWQPLVAVGVTTALLWIYSEWKPRLLFDRQAAVDLVAYGGYLVGHTSLNYWLRNGDKLAIGKFLSAHDLGIYARAYSLMLLPINNISAVLGQVMFPALASLQGDRASFRNSYALATRMIALITFPLMFGIAATCEPLILSLFGQKWIEVVPVLRVLSFVALFQSIVNPVGWVFTSLGKTKPQFLLSIVLTIAFVPCVALGIRFGIQGVAYAYAGWTLLAGWLNLRLAGRYIGLSPIGMLLSVAKIFVMAACMGAIVFGLDKLLAVGGWSPPFRVLALFACGVASYLGLCLLANDETFLEFTRLISRRLAGMKKRIA